MHKIFLKEKYVKNVFVFQITVAIIGNETLDTLQEWAEEIFTAIPNKEKTKPGDLSKLEFLSLRYLNIFYVVF